MRRFLFLSGILLSAILLLPSCSAIPVTAQDTHSDVPRDLSPKVKDSDLAELVAGNNDFAFALYQQLFSGDENLFYSPYSISTALAMTYAGASNRTADQMAQALHYTLPQERLHPAFNKLALELAGRAEAEGLKPGQAFQLSVANALWGQIDFHFEPDFLDLLARNYAAGMRLVDFTKDPDSVRREINDWVSRETKEKVKDIVPAGVIKDITRLVLANAVYFKAAWQYPFPQDATQPGEFFLADGTVTQASMMRQQADLRSMQGGGYRAVELPYAGGKLSMLILLPDEGQFTDVESRLEAGLLDATVDALQDGEVILTLPKFKFEWEAKKLPEDFASLGMTDAFSSAADFSGMTGKPDLFIGAILHKAFVGVDESGTEAAAATVVVMDREALPLSTVDFTIDHPFFFVIRDNPTGAILFLGRVTNPAV
ncbi:MAG: serpin family protein [Anaerolineales bacterium]